MTPPYSLTVLHVCVLICLFVKEDYFTLTVLSKMVPERSLSLSISSSFFSKSTTHVINKYHKIHLLYSRGFYKVITSLMNHLKLVCTVIPLKVPSD